MAIGWLIQVEVQPGTFSNERFVSFETTGRKYNLLVDAEDVVRHNGGNYLKVYFVDERNDKVLIDLPRDTFTSGPRALVDRGQLQPAPG